MDDDKTREELTAEVARLRRRVASLEKPQPGEPLPSGLRELQSSHTWFRRLLDAAPDAMIIADRQGTIVLCNRAATQLFGYSAEELTGVSVELLVPASVRENHRQYRLDYTANPRVRSMGSGLGLSAVRKDGTVFSADISISPVRTDEGMLVFAAIRDITHIKRAEQALRESEERFELAVRGTDAGIWDWDLRTNEVFFSPRWKGMLGYSPDEISSSFSEWENRLHPDDRKQASVAIGDYLEGKSPTYEFEHRLRHKDGSYRWILSRGAAVFDHQGHAYRMVGSHLDITKRKGVEEQLRRREAELVAAQEIQRLLLPHASPVLEECDIDGTLVPAEFAAGDFFDYLTLKNGRFAVVVGDVSGHGIGPALMMASTHAHIRSFAATLSNIGQIVCRTNSAFVEETAPDRFVTLIMACFDPRSMTLEYVNAGHPSGYVLDASGNVKTALKSSSLPLGIMADEKFQASEPLKLETGDVLLLLTDGILEAGAPDSKPFGVDRSLAVVRENRLEPARAIVEALHSAVYDFVGHKDFKDDVTAVVMKVKTQSWCNGTGTRA